MLKAIPMPGDTQPLEPEYGSDSPTVVCEACAKPGPSHLMINCMIAIGSPGHPSLPAFQCAAVEHWACSPECWRNVAHACIDEHMHALLLAHRSTVNL
jgi:hypothetical protein